VCLFPVVLLTTVLSQVASRTLLAVSSGSGDPNVGVGIVSFVLAVVSFRGGILVAFTVAICLLADIRALRHDEQWSPSIAWGLAGVAHLIGTEFGGLLLVSTPLLSLYVYRRYTNVSSGDIGN